MTRNCLNNQQGRAVIRQAVPGSEHAAGWEYLEQSSGLSQRHPPLGRSVGPHYDPVPGRGPGTGYQFGYIRPGLNRLCGSNTCLRRWCRAKAQAPGDGTRHRCGRRCGTTRHGRQPPPHSRGSVGRGRRSAASAGRRPSRSVTRRRGTKAGWLGARTGARVGRWTRRRGVRGHADVARTFPRPPAARRRGAFGSLRTGHRWPPDAAPAGHPGGRQR